MKLLVVLITYNRLAYTKQTLHSLWANTSDTADYCLVIVDNNSTDGTQKYLKELQRRGRADKVILNPDNYYPGKACNIGWDEGLKIYEPTHLMRLDNDMQLAKDWDLKVAEYFKAIPELGQLGIEHEAIEHPEAELKRRVINGMVINEFPGCVGGPMVMPRKLWDIGLRYDERPWTPKWGENDSAPQEDALFSIAIKNRGFIVAHAQEELGRTFATAETWKEYPDYYKKTFKERGIGSWLEGHI